MRTQTGLPSLAVVAACLVCASSASATAQLSRTLSVGATAQLNATADFCDNTTSQITVDGTVTIGGVAVDLRFENQDANTGVPGHHAKSASSTAVLTLSDITPNTIPKQPVRGGVGGNPFIYVRFVLDGAPTDWVLIGRCVQGSRLKSVQQGGYLTALAAVALTSLSCDQRGTQVGVDGNASHGGVDADVVFTNSRKWTHWAPGDAELGLSLTPAVSVPKQGSVGGVGGNPIISAGFHTDVTSLLDEWTTLGRCNQI